MLSIGSEMDYFIFEETIDPREYLPSEEKKQYDNFKDTLKVAIANENNLEYAAGIQKEYNCEVRHFIIRLELCLEKLKRRAYDSYCECQKELLKILSVTTINKREQVTRGAAIKNTERKGSF